MAGLTVGTVFTMIVVPVLYTAFYRISPERTTLSQALEAGRGEITVDG
jgi:hypothetical protein